MRDIARPALAEVLATITSRPVGHWRAELASPAFVRAERISSRDVQWTVRIDPFRATTQTRRATLRSTEPAYEARRVGNTLTRVEVSLAHTITPAEAVEALAGLWPWSPGDGPRWWCERCGGTGRVSTVTRVDLRVRGVQYLGAALGGCGGPLRDLDVEDVRAITEERVRAEHEARGTEREAWGCAVYVVRTAREKAYFVVRAADIEVLDVREVADAYTRLRGHGGDRG